MESSLKLGWIIKTVIRTLTLIDITAVAMFSLYVSMHSKTVLNAISDEEYFYTFLFGRSLFFISNVWLVRAPSMGMIFLMSSMTLLVPLTMLDIFSIIVTANQTYQITTMVMKAIFIAQDILFIIFFFAIGIFSKTHWIGYIKNTQEGFYSFWDTPVGSVDKNRDSVVRGLVTTLLPIETIALLFYLLTIISVGNSAVSGWVFVLHGANIIVSGIWLGIDKETVSLYSSFISILFLVFTMDMFQLLLIKERYEEVVFMRAILISITSLYLLIIIIRGYRFDYINRVYLLYQGIHLVIFSLSIAEVMSVFLYLCYADATRRQHSFYANSLHLLSSSFAVACQYTKNVKMAANTFLIVAMVVFGSDVFFLGTSGYKHHTETELWIQGGFLGVSVIYVFVLFLLWPSYTNGVHTKHYYSLIETLEDTYSVNVLFSYSVHRLIYIVNRIMVILITADISALLFYIGILFDGKHIQWFNWFVVAHGMTIILGIANSAPFVHIHVRIGCVLTLVSAVISTIIDFFILGFSINPDHSITHSSGIIIIRSVLLAINFGYISALSLALYIPEKESKEEDNPVSIIDLSSVPRDKTN